MTSVRASCRVPFLAGAGRDSYGEKNTMSENITNNPNQDGCGGERPSPGKKSVSVRKVVANRKNAQKSTGPRTEVGKAKAAANSYQHGFFSKNLFLTPEQVAKDQANYLAVVNGFNSHFQPVGYLENFWVEKIATEALRSARLISHEQTVLGWSNPFESRSASNLLRYQTSVNRELARAIQELERFQEIRNAGSKPSGPSDSSEGEPWELKPPTDGPSSIAGEPVAHPAGDPSTSSAPTPDEGDCERPEAIGSGPATHESRGTNPLAIEASVLVASKIQESDVGVPQRREPGTETQSQSKEKYCETNASTSLADLISDVLDDDESPY
jgi:hypothetical protein